MSRLLTAVLTICLTGAFSFLYAQDDSDVKRYITENATQLWGNYLKALQNGVEGDVHFQSFYNDKPVYQYEWHVIREKEWGLEETEDLPENSVRVESVSDGYSFEISRKSDSQDWNVYSVKKTSPSTTTSIKDYSFPTGNEQTWDEVSDEVLRKHILKGYSIFGLNLLPTLLRLPEFTIESAEKVNRDGVDYYQVNYSFNQPTVSLLLLTKNPYRDYPLNQPTIDKPTISVEEAAEIGGIPVKKYPLIVESSGSLLLTTDYLLIKEAEVNIKGYGTHTIKNDYKIVDGVPLISESNYTSHKDKGDYKEAWTFDLRLGTNYGPSRFKLSYYGLSEPNWRRW